MIQTDTGGLNKRSRIARALTPAQIELAVAMVQVSSDRAKAKSVCVGKMGCTTCLLEITADGFAVGSGMHVLSTMLGHFFP